MDGRRSAARRIAQVTAADIPSVACLFILGTHRDAFLVGAFDDRVRTADAAASYVSEATEIDLRVHDMRSG
jgi:hypothetical protein